MGCLGGCIRLSFALFLLTIAFFGIVLFAPIPESWTLQPGDFSSDATYQADLAAFNRAVGLLKEARRMESLFSWGGPDCHWFTTANRKTRSGRYFFAAVFLTVGL